MNLFPIAIREARLIARRPHTFHIRWLVAAIGLYYVAYEALLSQAIRPLVATPGAIAFSRLSMVGMMFAAFAGAIFSADSISRERREGTLRLLFLTPLKAHDIIAGKFVSAAAVPLASLLALLPLLAVPLLMGGVQPIAVAFMAAHLLNILFFSIALGFLISSIFVNALATLAVSVALAAALMFYPFLLHPVPTGMFAPQFLMGAAGTVNRAVFLRGIVQLNLLAWLFLVIAAIRSRNLSDGPATVRAEKGRNFFHALRFGGKKQRARLRRKLLDQNPLAWIANREQVSSAGLIGLCFLLLAFPLIFPRYGSFDGLFQGYLLAQALIALKIAATAASQLSTDRDSGALELLLATPLSVEEILAGRARALFRQFFGPGAVLLSIHLMATILVLFSAPGEESRLRISCAFIGYAILGATLWRALAWQAMWQGLRRKRLLVAIGWSLALTVVPLLLIYQIISWIAASMMRGINFGAMNSGYEATLRAIESLWIFGAPAAAYAILAVATALARRKLLRDFREAAVANHRA